MERNEDLQELLRKVSALTGTDFCRWKLEAASA